MDEKLEEKINIRTLELSELENYLKEKGFEAYRSKQVYNWLWKKHTLDFDLMSDLSKELRELLKQKFYIRSLIINRVLESKDGSLKLSFTLNDKAQCEGVLIPAGKRVTACLSTQVGCRHGCLFCATGNSGFERDLGADEIFSIFVLLNDLSLKQYDVKISNIVYMGMGEPLLNYDNSIKSIKQITAPGILGYSPSRITLSTVGISNMIKKLADEDLRINLAISLHCANDDKRNYIVPANKKHNLASLAEALVYFYKKTKIRITYEYLLLKDYNDSLADAEDFARFCKITPCKINLIEYNSFEGCRFAKSDETTVKRFAAFLERKNLVVNIRKSKGADIAAACGQLAGINSKKQL